MRSFSAARNLLPVTKKPALRRVFSGAMRHLTFSLFLGSWLSRSADTKYCPSSVVVVRLQLQELCRDSSQPPLRESSYQWLLPVAFYVSFPGWPQENSYRNRRSSRAERGGPALQPRPGANCLSRPRYRKVKMRVSYEKAPRVPQGRKAVRYPVNDMAGMWRPQEGAVYRKRWIS